MTCIKMLKLSYTYKIALIVAINKHINMKKFSKF